MPSRYWQGQDVEDAPRAAAWLNELEAQAYGGSIAALSSGGPPTGTGYTYATNDVYTDVNGVAWQCTAAGAPGTWRFFGTGFIPGITTNDNTSGTDYGAVINTYMATLGPYQDTPKLPPASIYVGTEVIPPQGITLVGSRWSENANVDRATVLRPLGPGMARVASCTNVDSGFRNLVVDGRPIGDANVATVAFGVYAGHCKLDHFQVIGGSTTTFDSNSSATNLDIEFFNFQQTGGIPTNVLVANGSDWIVTNGRLTGNANFVGGGNLWTNVHFVSPSTGSTNSFVDGGGQTFTGCYFDTMPSGASAMIDRSSAGRQSQYTGCNFFTPIGGFSATSAVFKETATAGAGVTVTGGQLRASGSTAWGYFIKDPIASTSVNGLNSAYTFQTAFTNQTQPLGSFQGCFNAGVLASLGGSFPGSNQSVRAAILAAGIGVLSEPFPASAIISAPLAPTSQKVFGSAVGLKRGDVATGVMLRNSTAAAGTNPTVARFGLADSTGKILVLTGDVGAAANWGTGALKFAFTGPYTVTADGVYYAVFLVNGTWGTTQPTPGLNSATAALTSAAAGGLYPVFEWAAQTDLPAIGSSVTFGSTTRAYYLAAY